MEKAFSAHRTFCNDSNEILRQTFLFCIMENIAEKKLSSILFL